MRLLARAVLFTGLSVASSFCAWLFYKAPLHAALAASTTEFRWICVSIFVGCAFYFLALALNHRLLGISDGRENHSIKAVRAIILVIAGWLFLIVGSALLTQDLWGLVASVAGVHVIAFGLLQHVRLFRFQGG